MSDQKMCVCGHFRGLAGLWTIIANSLNAKGLKFPVF